MRSTTSVLRGVRILSVAPNVPGPAALMRCRAMGARCVKLESPAGDPMRAYSEAAYAHMHRGVAVRVADLKTDRGQSLLRSELAKADVLVTSSRPSTLRKLGLAWKSLHTLYPALSQVAIVGWRGERAEEAGHDLTYLADQDLIQETQMPATLYADMAGSLMVSEAVLQAALQRPRGVFIEVGLADAAAYVALPRAWGLTVPAGILGGANAGYRVYTCRDGRVAVAALEGQFVSALCTLVGVNLSGVGALADPKTHDAISRFFAGRTRRQLDRLARERALPMCTLPPDM